MMIIVMITILIMTITVTKIINNRKVLYCTALHFSVSAQLDFIVLHCNVLYCAALYCTAL